MINAGGRVDPAVSISHQQCVRIAGSEGSKSIVVGVIQIAGIGLARGAGIGSCRRVGTARNWLPGTALIPQEHKMAHKSSAHQRHVAGADKEGICGYLMHGRTDAAQWADMVFLVNDARISCICCEIW